MDQPALVVAIDGPSGSGKSTVARRVASSFGLRYLDTGAMYRALTWWVLEQQVDVADSGRVAELAKRLPLVMGTDPAEPTVHVAGDDVSAAIRTTRVTNAVSTVAVNPGVREEMRRRQRAVVEEGDVVVEGRDMTTVVAADAAVRVLLTAHADTRLARRARERHGTDDESSLARTREEVVRRDAQDAAVSEFLEAAEGVTVVDSSQLTIDETAAAVVALVEQWKEAPA